jgi:hypothetical protein
VLALNIWSEARRESSLSGRLPENFYELTEDVTGYGEQDWNRYIAMRLSLRYLLGKLFKVTFDTKEPPESITTMLVALTERRVVPEPLCEDIETIRDATYSIEWARGDQAVGTQLHHARTAAPEAFKELRALIAKTHTPMPAKSSKCVKEIREKELIRQKEHSHSGTSFSWPPVVGWSHAY